MDISDKIHKLRVHKSMTQKELSSALGVSVVSLQCWENGSKKPSMGAIISLSRLFNVTTDYLLGVSQNHGIDISLLSTPERKLLEDYRALDSYGKKTVEMLCSLEKSRCIAHTNRSDAIEIARAKTEPHRYIPRYTTPSAAGNSVPLDGDDFEMILVDDSVPYEADFAVGIQGNSMYPYIHDGDTVYVKRNAELSIGDVGIFCVDGAMYCKQYYVDEERNLTLVSANPELRSTNIHVNADNGSDVKCYGKVLLGYRIGLPDYFTE